MLVATSSHRFTFAMFLFVLFIQKVLKSFSLHKLCEAEFPNFVFKDQPEILTCMSWILMVSLTLLLADIVS